MALKVPFGLPFGSSPDEPTATGDELLGHTAPEPTGDELPMPRVGAMPFGQSGRANFWGFPQPDETNPQLIGPSGLRKFDHMYRSDAHVRRLVLAAWSPIVAGTWTLEPYGGEDTTQKDKDIADQIWWMLTEFMKPNFSGHLYQIGAALLRSGFLSAETLWSSCKYKGSGPTLLAPRKLMQHLPSSIWRWWQDDFGELTYVGQMLPNRGEVIIPATDLVYYQLGAEGDNWPGTSLLRHAYKSWYLKDKLEMIDAIGQERKAVGVPVCYPPQGASKQQKALVEQALASMHMSEVAYLMMPGPKAGSQGANGVPQDEWLIDIIKFDSSSGEGIMNSIAYHQTAISSSFLTDFLELGHHQVGARATAEVQEDPFLTAINGALLPPVVPPLNALVDRIRRANWDSADGSPTLKLTLHDEASLSEIAGYIVPLVTAGVLQVDPEIEDYARERANLPPADPVVRAQKQKAQQAGFDAAAQLAKTGETPGEEPPNPDTPPKPGQEPPPTRSTATGKQEPAEPRAVPAAPAKPAAKKLDQGQPAAGGVIVHAADTGRVLVAQRTPDDSDSPDVFGSYEFPGGKLDGGPNGSGDASDWAGAKREWQEETGAQLPDGVQHVGNFTSPDGNYRAFVVRVAHETDIPAAHHDQAEVSDVTWQHPSSLGDGQTSQRMRALLPPLTAMLDRNPPMALDGAMSGGVQDASGLQMVPDVGQPKTCTCKVGPWDEQGVCEACGGTRAAKKLDAGAEPTVKWFERLVSQDRLREAFDGARDHIQAAVSPQALDVARKMAHQAANGVQITAIDPPSDLVDALTAHYQGLYELGHGTVQDELAKQRAALPKTLDEPADADAAVTGERLARARQRGQHSARNIVNKIGERLGRDQITGLKDPTALQTGAEQAATSALRQEALSNATSMVNDGRADAAQSAGDVVGGVYTSVLDERACDPCIASDTGDVLSVEAALALGPPNPYCQGGDYCRCLILWVLSDDPAALAAI